jgi:putative transposase
VATTKPARRPAPAIGTGIGAAGCARPRARSSTACPRSRIGPSPSCPACGRARRADGRAGAARRRNGARGLSTRDVEAAFRDATGTNLLSRTAVSQVTERLWQEYEAFAARDLGEFAVAYFFVDGVAERLHAGLPREAVLCAWGVTEDGRKVLRHLAPGTKEDTASCTAFFEDLKRRGLPDPMLAVTDGAPGLIRAVETCFPRALRQRCLVHRLRNLRSKAPDSQWPAIAIRARACYEAASPALAALLRDDFVQAYGRDLPAVVQCFVDDFDACIAHLRFPLRHRKVIRTTNLLERLFLEERRRTKIIPHAFGERPVLKLMYAAVIRAADHWRGLTVGEFEQRQLKAIREELNHAHAQRVAPAVIRATSPVVQKLPGTGRQRSRWTQ